jgi:hypothetical protein
MRFELKYYYSLNGSIYSGGNPEYEGECYGPDRGNTKTTRSAILSRSCTRSEPTTEVR